MDKKSSKPDLNGASPFEIREIRKAIKKPTPVRSPKDTTESPNMGGRVAGSYGDNPEDGYKKGGIVKRMASGGAVRGDGCASRGKTKGRMV